MTDRAYRCSRLVGTIRCGFTGSNDEAGEHWRETGHGRCLVIRGYDGIEPRRCGQFLRDEEAGVCGKCIARTRDAILTIRDSDLEPIIEATALHPGDLPGGRALVMAAGGNTDALRPYKAKPDSTPLDLPHHALVGALWCWLPYWEHRAAADGREHFADHWRSDPLIPLPELDAVAVAWRTHFGEMIPDTAGTVADVAAYLLHRLHEAADSWPDFDEDAHTLCRIAAQVANITGQVNRPETAEAKCFNCGSDLISPYREPLTTVPEQGRLGLPREGREMAPPDDRHPDAMPEPVWQCADKDCARVYLPVEYRLAVHFSLLAEAEKAG